MPSGNGTTVEATLQANAWDATRTAMAGGAGPDVVGTPGPSFVMQLALAGQLVELDPYAEQYGWNERFAEGSLSLGTANGKLYSIPSEIETLVLYYNKTLFEQNEWMPPTTLDELMALAEEINAAGIIPFAHSNAEWRPANEWFVGEFLNHSAGGPQKVYDALTGERSLDGPRFRGRHRGTEPDAAERLVQRWSRPLLHRHGGGNRGDVRRRGSGDEDRGHLVPRERGQLLRRGGWQRERVGLGAGAVGERRGHFRPWHRSDQVDQRQLGES